VDQNPRPENMSAGTVPWYFVQVVQKFPEPGWIVKEYIDEKKGGQWQEKDTKVNQEYG
jgi:hypothetical protein